jgi:hypothetical protein
VTRPKIKKQHDSTRFNTIQHDSTRVHVVVTQLTQPHQHISTQPPPNPPPYPPFLPWYSIPLRAVQCVPEAAFGVPPCTCGAYSGGQRAPLGHLMADVGEGSTEGGL